VARFIHEAQADIKAKKGVATVYFVLRGLVILMLVLQALNHNYEAVMLCVLSLLLFLLPPIVERKLRVEFPNAFEIIIFLFIFAAEILGEVAQFYTRFHGWDTMLHTMNGFLCAAIGFCLVDLLNRNEHFSLSLSPAFLAIVAFCFSMTVGVLWEFFEFSMDQAFYLDMQKDFVVSTVASVNLDETGSQIPVQISGIQDVILVTDHGDINMGVGGYLDIGIIDTMKDLFVNFIGAVVFSLIGFFYVQHRDRRSIASQLIPVIKEDEDYTI